MSLFKPGFMFSKYSFFLLSALFICLQVSAQRTLSGKVLSASTGKPIEAASVYINDLRLGAVTDTSGNYHFKNLPAGNYVVEARSLGYKSVTQNISFTSTSTHDFSLPENIVEESEVVVTGLSKAAQIRRSSIPIVSISHAAIASNINNNIIDAITKVPGITAVTTGPNISKPYIRGLGFNRILTLYDGVRQEGQQWGDEHGIEVDQYSIDRVEVVKGPASLSYGSDALAGVVNLIPTQPAPEGKMIGDVTTEYHTNNGQFGGTVMLGGTKNGWEWMGRLSDKEAANYQNKTDGRVYGTSFKERDATAYLGKHGNWGYSHLSFSLFDDKQKIPDGSRDSATGRFTKQVTEDDDFRPVVSDGELKSYGINGTYQRVQHYRLYSNSSFILGNSRLAVNLAYQNSHRREFSHPEYLDIPGLDLRLNTYNYDVKYYFPESNGWNVSLGVNGMYQHNDVTKGTDFIIPSYNQFDIGPFIYAKKTLDKWDISGGIRYDIRDFSNKSLYTTTDPETGFDIVNEGAIAPGETPAFAAYKHTYSGASGSLGFAYNANEHFTIKANIARGFRAPNISEISADGVHPGTNIYQIGSTAFKPEFSLQEDIGFVYSSKVVIINLSLFNNNISHYIFNQKLLGANGQDSVIIDGNQTFKFQQGKAQLYGGEANIDFHIIPQLHFENSLSAVWGENKATGDIKINDSSRYLPLVPPFHGMSELRYDFASKQHHIVNGFIKAQVIYYASQNRVYLTDDTETPTAGYALFNAGVGCGFTNKKGKTMFNLYVMGDNLFNVSYYDHLSRLKYFAPDYNPDLGIHNMGRNISFKLDVPLSFNIK